MQNGWETLFELYRKTFYTPLPLYPIVIIALIVALRFKEQTNVFFHFKIYIIAMLILICVYPLLYITSMDAVIRNSVIEALNLVFAGIELHTFLIFFGNIFRNNVFNRIALISLFGFYVITIIAFTTSVNGKWESSTPSNIADKPLAFEMLVLSLCALKYFLFIFNNPSEDSLTKSPSFWIVSGLFFYTLSNLPFFFVSGKIFQFDKSLHIILFSIHYIFTSILFLLIIKALLCRRILTS